MSCGGRDYSVMFITWGSNIWGTCNESTFSLLCRQHPCFWPCLQTASFLNFFATVIQESAICNETHRKKTDSCVLCSVWEEYNHPPSFVLILSKVILQSSLVMNLRCTAVCGWNCNVSKYGIIMLWVGSRGQGIELWPDGRWRKQSAQMH